MASSLFLGSWKHRDNWSLQSEEAANDIGLPVSSRALFCDLSIIYPLVRSSEILILRSMNRSQERDSRTPGMSSSSRSWRLGRNAPCRQTSNYRLVFLFRGIPCRHTHGVTDVTIQGLYYREFRFRDTITIDINRKFSVFWELWFT